MLTVVVGTDAHPAALGDGESGFHPVIYSCGNTYYLQTEVFPSPDAAAAYARGIMETRIRNVGLGDLANFGWLLEKQFMELTAALQNPPNMIILKGDTSRRETVEEYADRLAAGARSEDAGGPNEEGY